MSWKVIQLDDVNKDDYIRVVMTNKAAEEGKFCYIYLWEGTWYLEIIKDSKIPLVAIETSSIAKIYRKDKDE